MRFASALLAAALALAAPTVGRAAAATSAPFRGACHVETVDPDAVGAASQAAAVRFVHVLTTGDVATLRSMFTPDLQATASDAQVGAAVDAVRALRLQGEPKLSKAYLLVLDKAPTAVAQVPCLAPGPNKGMDFVAAAPPATQQAHVLYTMDTVGDGVAAVEVWLQRGTGGWAVEGFHADPARMGGRDAFEWRDIAKTQLQEGHPLIAMSLYYTARRLLYRGPDYQPAGLVQLEQEIEALSLPSEMKGQPPFHWTLDGQSFQVLQMAPVGVPGGKVVLSFVLAPYDWSADQEADARNHAFIEAFMKAHPEWSEVYDYLAARTCKPDHSYCFGSLYAKGAGYMHKPG